LKNRWLAFVFAAALCLGVMLPVRASQQTFSDVPAKHWAFKAVESANADGVMTGTGNGKFSPDAKLTVAEFAAILTRAFYGDEVDASAATGAWYAKYMDVYNKHRLKGEDTRFDKPQDAVYRVDMAAVMRCILLDKGIADPPAEELQRVKARIPDPDFDYPEFYERGVLVCCDRELLTGTDDKGTFNGEGLVTRAETAAVYLRLRDYLEGNGGSDSSAPAETRKPAPSAPVETQDPAPGPTPSGDTTFKFLPGETCVQDMMDRINAATPAYREGYLTNGKPITDENILEMLAEIEKAMPQDSEWNEDDKYLYFSRLGWGGGCNSFSYAVSDAIFGEDAPITQHKNYKELKVGDVIWLEGQVPGASPYSHVMIAMSEPDENGRFLTCSGNVGGEVFWRGRDTIPLTMEYVSFAENSIIYTRYGEVTQTTYDPLLPFDPYEKYPEVRCLVCGFVMRPAGSNQTMDFNGGIMCGTCPKCYGLACYQCMNTQAWQDHIASCDGQG